MPYKNVNDEIYILYYITLYKYITLISTNCKFSVGNISYIIQFKNLLIIYQECFLYKYHIINHFQ